MNIIFRGRRSIWGNWRMIPDAPHIVLDVLYVTRINYEIGFAWQARFPETPRSSFLRSQFGKPLLGSKSGFPNWLPGFQEAAS